MLWETAIVELGKEESRWLSKRAQKVRHIHCPSSYLCFVCAFNYSFCERTGSGLGETRQERTKRMRRMEHATLSEIDMQQDQYEEFNLEHFDVPLSQWVAQEQTQQEIKRRFVSRQGSHHCLPL